MQASLGDWHDDDGGTWVGAAVVVLWFLVGQLNRAVTLVRVMNRP
ncbi:hypothetical protein [Arthrobacter monumenti]